MERQLLKVQSITYAMKGKTILEKHKIAATIERTPKTGNEKSCGYSLAVNKNAADAKKILEENGITVTGVADRGM